MSQSVKMMPTPVGPMPIRASVVKAMDTMTDREVANKAFEGPFIDPEHFAELLHRKLSAPGMFEVDTYRLIEDREKGHV